MEKKCLQCGLPDMKITYGRNNLPIDDKGTCLFCHDYNENHDLYQVDFKKNQEQFLQLVEKTRGKHRYDAVIMYTGGKDSGYAAYYLAKELKLKVLAVTWDNGFFGDQHKKNLTNLIKNLGIDHKFISIGEDNLAGFYRNRMEKLGRFCACTQPALLFCAEEIARSEAPLVIIGVSFGQQLSLLQNRLLFEFDPQKKLMVQKVIHDTGMGIHSFQDPGFFIGALLDVISGDYSDEMTGLLKNCASYFQKMMKEERYVTILSLIFNFNHKTMTEVLSGYGWKKPENTHNAGHTSCIMEHMKGYVAFKQDMLNLDYLEIAAERRWGRFTRETFEEILPTIHFYEEIPKELDIFLKVAKMSKQDFDRVIERRPFAQKSPPPVNWDLVDKLSLGIDKVQLMKYMDLAYSRGIP